MVAQLIKTLPAFCGTQRRTVAFQEFGSSLESVVGCLKSAAFHMIHTNFRLLFCGKWAIIDLGDHHVARARVPSCIFEFFFTEPCVNMTFEVTPTLPFLFSNP